MRLALRTADLPLAETFTIARDSRDVEHGLFVQLEHDGITGHGEASPVDFWGETVDTATAFLENDAPKLLGDDPWALEDITRRLAGHDGEQAAKCALDAA